MHGMLVRRVDCTSSIHKQVVACPSNVRACNVPKYNPLDTCLVLYPADSPTPPIPPPPYTPASRIPPFPFQCPFVRIPSFHRFLRPPLILLLFRLRDVAIVQGRDAVGRCSVAGVQGRDVVGRCSVAIARGHSVVERRSTQGRDIALTGRGRCVTVITQGRGVVGRCSAQGTIPPASHDEGLVLSFGGGASVPLSATYESARVWALPARVAEVSAIVGVAVGTGASMARSAGEGSWRGSALRLCGLCHS